MPDPLLRCKDLSCGYPGRTVLSGIGFEIQPGEVVALLGPNGSGKSTLLKTILRSLPAIGGSVELGGKSLTSLSFREIAQKLAFVPQEELPAFAFPVWQVVAMGRMPVSGGFFDSAEDIEAAEAAMRKAECLDLRDRSIQELSGGERQRVLIARALAQGTPMLLLDEPSAHLDVSHQLTLIELASQLAGQGMGVLAAVHDLNLASSMAGRAILLSNGTIGKDGPMRQILEDPLLEEVYQVEFQRSATEDSLRVWPARKRTG